jgi:hypothetical protein
MRITATRRGGSRPTSHGWPELLTGGREMAIELTAHEIGYLEKLCEHDQTMTGLKDRSGLKRLVQAVYVTEQSINVQETIYSITEAGRGALAKTKR